MTVNKITAVKKGSGFFIGLIIQQINYIFLNSSKLTTCA